MKSSELATAILDAWKTVQPLMRDELLKRVDERIESFRRSVYVRDEWCCNEMRRFAVDTWGAAKPRTEMADHFGSVAYSLRGHHVNYCPFCGVAFNASKTQ